MTATKIYVLIRTTGEYSDRNVISLGYVKSESLAKSKVLQLDRSGAIEDCANELKDDLRCTAYKEWSALRSCPDFAVERPIFDQDRRTEPEYVALHTSRKREYEKSRKDYNDSVFMPWFMAREAYVEKYVKDNFNPLDVVISPNCRYWTKSTHHYEEIEELN